MVFVNETLLNAVFLMRGIGLKTELRKNNPALQPNLTTEMNIHALKNVTL